MSVEVVGFYFDRLTALRGLKVKFVAERAGVKPGYVSRLISRDIKEPSAAVLKALTAPGQSLRNNTKKPPAISAAVRQARPLPDREWYI